MGSCWISAAECGKGANEKGIKFSRIPSFMGYVVFHQLKILPKKRLAFLFISIIVFSVLSLEFQKEIKSKLASKSRS